MYKYPYASAEIFVTNAISPNTCCFQDVDRIGNRLFFHPTASQGLFVYDLSTGQTTELLFYGGGDAIAADSPFVFCDIMHHGISRFNIVTNSVDLQFTLLSGSAIAGLETYQGFLFVLTLPSQLNKFSYDGVLLDSIPYPESTYFLTIHDSVCYSLRWQSAGDHLTRFDLRTQQSLPDLPAPAWGGEGIKIYENSLYYCDWFKRFLGVIPLDSITTHI